MSVTWGVPEIASASVAKYSKVSFGLLEILLSDKVKLKVVCLSGSESHCFNSVGFSTGIGNGLTVSFMAFEVTEQLLPFLDNTTLYW